MQFCLFIATDLNHLYRDIRNNLRQKYITARINRRTLDYPSTAEGVQKIRSVHSGSRTTDIGTRHERE